MNQSEVQDDATLEDIRPDALLLYLAYEKQFGIPSQVFYPGCGTDVTPAKAFTNSKVIFLDPSESAKNTFTKKPYSFVPTNAENYQAESQHDLVIDMHSQANLQAEIKDLKIGGKLLISNKTAEPAFANSNLKLVGIVKDSHKQPVTIETTNLEEYTDVDPRYNPTMELIERLGIFGFKNYRKTSAEFYIFEKIA